MTDNFSIFLRSIFILNYNSCFLIKFGIYEFLCFILLEAPCTMPLEWKEISLKVLKLSYLVNNLEGMKLLI
jgi:hypothetical protein